MQKAPQKTKNVFWGALLYVYLADSAGDTNAADKLPIFRVIVSLSNNIPDTRRNAAAGVILKMPGVTVCRCPLIS